MIPEIGQIAIIIALCLATVQAVFGITGSLIHIKPWIALGRPTAFGQLLFLAIAFGCLTWSFVTNDFSVLYVANNSNTALPMQYKVAAVWGAHEGSLLLWVLILSIWTTAVAIFSRSLPDTVVAQVLGVMGFICAGFLLFVIFTSNPFERLIPAAIDGADLNPLLQDPALIAHPPMLYAGYVGFSVAFAFAIAAMLSGKLDQNWARWTRPWTTMAWLFLTIGICLGSWWAYYELGWGGWWFWDPVENASFMPWLVGTALIHSLAVTEKRGLFKSSTLLLAIGAFSLSLLGTFLVRSGVLVSVHAFATDPARGVFILAFLGVVVGGALALYAWRASSLEVKVGFEPGSRETFMLINSILLVIAAGLILLGTLYPLILDSLNMGKISVGPPYFEMVFIIPMLPLVLCMGVGMHTAWRSADMKNTLKRLRWPALAAVTIGVAGTVYMASEFNLLTAVGVVAGLWTVFAASWDPVRKLFGKGPKITRAMLGMQLAHIGLGLTVIGITVTSSYSVETDHAIKPGESVEVAGYDFEFERYGNIVGPNYDGVQGVFTVTKDNKAEAALLPEKRVYRVRKSPMTEAGIDSAWSRDLFVAMGDPLGEGAWSVRIQYRPMIRFIWFGCLIMALGGLVAVSDNRYRRKTSSARGASNDA
jgi:cytochrome c-type biogenesis protein CcmF